MCHVRLLMEDWFDTANQQMLEKYDAQFSRHEHGWSSKFQTVGAVSFNFQIIYTSFELWMKMLCINRTLWETVGAMRPPASTLTPPVQF